MNKLKEISQKKEPLKIALVVPCSMNPKQCYKEYPLGVGYIGTILLDQGYDVKIYDQNIEFSKNKELVLEIEKYAPDVIGFSVLTASYINAKRIIKLLKYLKYNGIIIAGGLHATLFPIQCLNDGIDFVVKGEGEIITSKLMKYFKGELELDSIPNIIYKKSNEIVENKNEINNINLNKLPIVNRSLFKIEKYSNHSIAGARGCPFKCSFCCSYNFLSNISNRNRSVASIIEEIIYLIKQHNAKDIFFTDDVFFANKNKLKNFCYEMKKNKINIRYVAQLRINMISEEVCMLLKESGCQKIEVGVESGSEIILRNTLKGISINNIKAGIHIAKNNKIRIKTNWIYGLPGSLEEQYKSIDLMRETLPNEISIHQFIPFPGTEYYNYPQKYGITFKNPKNFKSFCFGGLDENISYNYMSLQEYKRLIYDTIIELEKIGYVSNDICTSKDEYIYSTPLNKKSLSSTMKDVEI